MTKILDENGLQTYNNALQAKIAENYATKEYVNSLAGNAGIKYKVVDELPTGLIPIKNTMGMDLSGRTLIMKFNENMESLGNLNNESQTYNLITTTGSSIQEKIAYTNTTSGGAN